MLAILDLAEVRARVFRLSVAAYEALDDRGLLDKRVELVRGVIIAYTNGFISATELLPCESVPELQVALEDWFA